MAMLEIRDLDVFYGGIHALQGVSLDVNEGEVVSIIGANGAGKSSLMNAISGIVKYKNGEIIYKGEKLPPQPNKIVKSGVCQVPEGLAGFLGAPQVPPVLVQFRNFSMFFLFFFL